MKLSKIIIATLLLGLIVFTGCNTPGGKNLIFLWPNRFISALDSMIEIERGS